MTIATSPTPLDPNWVIAAISLVALVPSFVSLYIARRNRRSEIEQAFIQQRNEINLAFAEHKVRGPFAHLLNVPKQELDEYAAKACLLFLQLNLLNDAYQHRSLLPAASIASYESWAQRILRPWVHADPQLTETLKLIYATEDLMPRDVVNWMRQLIPAT